MVANAMLLTGTIIYLLLKVLILHFSSQVASVNRVDWCGFTNGLSNIIFMYGIFLFLKRFDRKLVPGLKNLPVRFLLQISGILVTYELLLGIWTIYEYLILGGIPVMVYHVCDILGIPDIGPTPFYFLLLFSSIFLVQFANNIDIYMAYYLDERVDLSTSQPQFGGVAGSDDETSVGTGSHTAPLRRSKYTCTESPICLEQSPRHCRRGIHI